jgi:hypothetical protein
MNKLIFNYIIMLQIIIYNNMLVHEFLFHKICVHV